MRRWRLDLMRVRLVSWEFCINIEIVQSLFQEDSVDFRWEIGGEGRSTDPQSHAQEKLPFGFQLRESAVNKKCKLARGFAFRWLWLVLLLGCSAQEPPVDPQQPVSYRIVRSGGILGQSFTVQLEKRGSSIFLKETGRQLISAAQFDDLLNSYGQNPAPQNLHSADMYVYQIYQSDQQVIEVSDDYATADEKTRQLLAVLEAAFEEAASAKRSKGLHSQE